MRGSVFGYEVESELPLERLRTERGSRDLLRVARAREPILDRQGELTAWTEGPDRPPFALARTAAGLVAWCGATGSYLLDAEAGRIEVEPAQGINSGWEHRLLSMALPIMLSDRGDLCLHASAVVVDGRAILFTAPSGRGKSTLAIATVALGHRVLAEDGAVVSLTGDFPTVWPGPRAVRLKGDAASAFAHSLLASRYPNGETEAPQLAAAVGFHQLPAAGEATEPVRVAAVIALDERGAALSISRLTPAEGLAALAANPFHTGRIDGLRPAYARTARLVERVPVYTAVMPDDLQVAVECARTILDHIAFDDPVTEPSPRGLAPVDLDRTPG